MDMVCDPRERRTLKGVKPKDRPPTRRPVAAELPEPTFYANGDPSEETLQVIRDFPVCPAAETRPLLEFILKTWKHKYYARETRPGLFVFAAEGSREETLIKTLRQSKIWSVLKPYSIAPGGLVAIAISEPVLSELIEKRKKFIGWLWGD